MQLKSASNCFWARLHEHESGCRQLRCRAAAHGHSNGNMVVSGMAPRAALASQVIALSAAALSRVVHPGGTLLHRSAPQHTRVSLALLPFQPLAVTISNGVGIQVPHSHAPPSCWPPHKVMTRHLG